MNYIKRLLLGLLLGILFIVGLVYGTDNSTPVSLAFLNWKSPEWPVSWWVMVAFALGIGVGYLMNIGMSVRTKVGTLKTKRELQKSKDELDKLRTINLQ
jgi:putative membrane protein